MKPDALTPELDELLRRVALAPRGELALLGDKMVDKLRAFALRERGLVTTQGIGVVVATITPAGALEAKTTELLSVPRGRSWSALRLPCPACRGAKPGLFEPACAFCREGVAKMACADHDPPQALPGCGCFDGTDRAMGMDVATARPLEDRPPRRTFPPLRAVKPGGG